MHKWRNVIGVINVCLFMACLVFGQTKFFMYQSEDAEHGTPLIWGKQYEVPSMHFVLLDKESGRPLSPKKILITYYWLWLKYPSIEMPWGAWTDADDFLECFPEGETEIIVPAHTVKPRGWYDGKYVRFPWPKKPHFDRIEIEFIYNNCSPNLILRAKDIEKLKTSIAVLTLPCGGRASVQYITNKKGVK